MSGRRFRFIHASDLHLEAPVCGLDEVPEHLRDLLLDAPFLAAQRMFEAAVSERVDFILLSGDVANLSTAGPRALDFLDRSFSALKAHGISVYWCESIQDHLDRWPTAVPIPDNVHIFSTAHVESRTISRDKKPLVKILGTRGTESGQIDVTAFEGDPTLFTIAMGHGFPSQDLEASFGKPNVDYWALGGLHNARDLQVRHGMARYCGSPQGRAAGKRAPTGFRSLKLRVGVR